MADLEPITREEHYLSAIAGLTELPSDMTPITREEMFLQEILDNGAGGGGEATGTKEISITENGVTMHNIKAYATAEITTNVPNPSTGTKQINTNGTHDVTDYASAQVNVPNSYSASDEGKVVDDGALVSQTSKNITSNGTVDTTLNNSVVVNVPVGEEVYFNSKGQQYTKNIYDTTTTGSPVTLEGMEFVETVYREKASAATHAGGYDCKNLKSVHFPQAPVGNHFFIREQNAGGKLEEVILGSIGHPVTNLTDSSWFYGKCANPCNITIFVDATALSDIPQNVLSYANGNSHPSNATVNVIFKSSTTGEVITA